MIGYLCPLVSGEQLLVCIFCLALLPAQVSWKGYQSSQGMVAEIPPTLPAGVQPRWIQGIRSGDGVGEDQETTA